MNRAGISNRYMWILELGLRKFDKEVLQSETGWLNDNIVDAAQILLENVCPIQGLQKVSLGLTLIFEVQRGEFIQILNTGAGHWVTISLIILLSIFMIVFIQLHVMNCNNRLLPNPAKTKNKAKYDKGCTRSCYPLLMQNA